MVLSGKKEQSVAIYLIGHIPRSQAAVESLEISKTDGFLSDTYSLVTCESDTVIVEGVKRSECDDELIVRLYEAYNAHSKAKLTVPGDYRAAYLCDLGENVIRELELRNGSVELDMKNFEIETIKFTR